MASGPGAVRRFLYRLPLLIEHAGGGAPVRAAARLLGIEWIVLDTVGRRSGKTHRVMLDVVGRDADGDVYYVQPAYGRSSHWVRNVAVHPEVAGRVGQRRFRARVRDATGPEGAAVVLRFLRAHPIYGRIVVWLVGYVDRLDRSDDELLDDLLTTPVFAVDVESGPAERAQRVGSDTPSSA